MVRFEGRIQELVETIPDLAVLMEPMLVVRRALREQLAADQQRAGSISRSWRARTAS